MNLEITFGCPEKERRVVAEILFHAFENKFKHVFGSQEQSIALISKHLRNDRIIVAHNKGSIVGVGGLKFKGKEFFDTTFLELLSELKFGIFRVIFYGWIFYSSVEEKELLLDVLAVNENVRGRGIGTEIINFIIEFAHSKSYERVKLYVIDINERAKSLFERLGFTEVKVHKILFPWNKILGFTKTIEMIYSLRELRSDRSSNELSSLKRGWYEISDNDLLE